MATSKFNTHQMPIITINYIAKLPILKLIKKIILL